MKGEIGIREVLYLLLVIAALIIVIIILGNVSTLKDMLMELMTFN